MVVSNDTNPTIEFFTECIPLPKGSMTVFAGKRLAMANANAIRKQQELVKTSCIRECNKLGNITLPHSGPVELHLVFYIPRPAYHFEPGKPKEPKHEYSSEVLPCLGKSGDIDKLCRLVLDALSTTLYNDDKQVYKLIAEKYYTCASNVNKFGINVTAILHT